jgi:hypothetical protein
MIGFTSTSVTRSLNHTYYSAIANLHNFQFTFAHVLGLSVSISRLLATDLNTETSTSSHYEVFLPFLVQSPWNLVSQLKLSWTASGLALYSNGTDHAQKTQPLYCYTTQKTSVTCQTASSLVRYQHWA